MPTLPTRLIGANNWSNIQQATAARFHSDDFFAEAVRGWWTYIRGWSWRQDWAGAGQIGAYDTRLKFGESMGVDAFAYMLPAAARSWRPGYGSVAYYDALRAFAARANDAGAFYSAMLFNWHPRSAASEAAYTDPDPIEHSHQKNLIDAHVTALKGLDFGLEVINEGPASSLAWQASIVAEIKRRHPGVPVFVNSGYGRGGAPLMQLLELGADVTAVPLAYSPAVPVEKVAGRTLIYDTDHMKEGLNAPTPAAGEALARLFLDSGENFSALVPLYGPGAILAGWEGHNWNRPDGACLGYLKAIRERDDEEPPPPEDDPGEDESEGPDPAVLFYRAVARTFNVKDRAEARDDKQLRQLVRRFGRAIRKE